MSDDIASKVKKIEHHSDIKKDVQKVKKNIEEKIKKNEMAKIRDQEIQNRIARKLG